MLYLPIYTNGKKSKSSLLFLYFSKEGSEFSISKNKELLGSTNKNIIKQILYHSLHEFLSEWKENIDNQNNQERVFTRILVENRRVIKFHEKRNRDFAIDIVDEINTLSNKHYTLTEEALNKIVAYEGKLIKIKDYIVDAISIIPGFSNKKSIYPIEDYHLLLDHSQEKELEDEIEIRYPDVYIFLDDLENAAKKAKEAELSIISKNISPYLKKAKKPPAITLAIQNKADKIIWLMRRYKGRWPLSLKNFTPLQNILQGEHDIMSQVN
ncbi:MAG: hypothetical protein U9R19_15385 [Bacteroidota bacterium]|nr:hypothetical protein [Bacteroidota bacterium]